MKIKFDAFFREHMNSAKQFYEKSKLTESRVTTWRQTSTTVQSSRLR